MFHQLPRSPSSAKKSMPGQEVPASLRSSSQFKKSQPGQEVSESQEVPARPRSTSQVKKSKPGQEVPVRQRSSSQAKKSQPGQKVVAKPRNPSQAKKFQKAKKSNIFNLDDHDSWETIGVTRTCQVFKNWRHIFVASSDLVRDLVDVKKEVGRLPCCN